MAKRLVIKHRITISRGLTIRYPILMLAVLVPFRLKVRYRPATGIIPLRKILAAAYLSPRIRINASEN